MAQERFTIQNSPTKQGLAVAGPQALMSEQGMWECENGSRDLFGKVQKRKGLLQWGNSLKMPKTDGLHYTEVFNDLSDFAVDTTNAGGNVFHELVDGHVRLFTTGLNAGTNDLDIARQSQPSDGAVAAGDTLQQSYRLLFRAQSLPAAVASQDYCPSIVGRTDLGTAHTFAFFDEGLHYKKASDLQWELIPNSASISDGRWHVLELRISSTTATVILDETSLGTTGAMATFNSAGTNQFTLRARTNASSTYSIEFDFVQGASGSTDPFVGSTVYDMRSWESRVPLTKHLMAIAGNAVYADTGHAGVFFAVDTLPDSPQPTLIPFVDRIIYAHKNQQMSAWDGKTSPTRLLNAPQTSLGAEHKGRLFVSGSTSQPLRVYFSGALNLNDWTTAEGGSFTTSGFFDIPDTDGSRVTAIRGNYYGDLIIWTKTSCWRATGSFVDPNNDFALVNVSDNLGCVGPRAFAQVGNDLYFQSLQGVHSLQTTLKYGDVETAFLSAPIMRLWMNDPYLDQEQVQDDLRSTMSYVPERNCVYLGVALQNDSTIQHVLEYNVGTQQWAGIWGVEAPAMAFARLSLPEVPTLMVGDESGRIAYQEAEPRVDFGSTGYTLKIRSPRLDGRVVNPAAVGHVKRWIELRVFVLPRGGPWKLKLDASTEEQGALGQISRTQNVHKRQLLTDSHQLNFSVLHSAESVGVITYRLDLMGRYLNFTLTQDGPDENIEILGYELDFAFGKKTQENI